MGEQLRHNVYKQRYFRNSCLTEDQSLGSAEEDILENLLIEHTSMSVYQMRPDEDDFGSDEDADDVARLQEPARSSSVPAWVSDSTAACR
ncbi:uncharacterized protein LOC127649251 isoform X2 [Xyrauchen texanus]|uniref:uncharacterized protein LOC127649251 isoform X2 n=1 Tax=Xyrauchen texanus TaxID=154827 RepID=UPI002242B9C1|nr:uncharacterized protein LOC127649251 isoform X2 [Xyrauchen texanus]